MSFWKPGPTYHSAGVAILFSENFKGKIQNIVNDNAGRIIRRVPLAGQNSRSRVLEIKYLNS